MPTCYFTYNSELKDQITQAQLSKISALENLCIHQMWYILQLYQELVCKGY